VDHKFSAGAKSYPSKSGAVGGVYKVSFNHQLQQRTHPPTEQNARKSKSVDGKEGVNEGETCE